MKICSTVMIVVASLVVACSAWDWKDGNNGQVKWDYNCDFHGSTMADQPSTGEQCGGLCIANSQCTYFVYRHGKCYMKNYGGGQTAAWHDGATCGYVPSRH